MKLLDVNILVQAHREDADRHPAIRSWLEEALEDSEVVAISELALSGCLRVITHPKVFIDPTPLDQALEFVADFHDRENVLILGPGEQHWSIFMDLCHKAEARGNGIPDAYHAALAIEHRCRWQTLDRGFARFPGLDWENPLD
jgi:toxin-antitoxin system PIN domain toxin